MSLNKDLITEYVAQGNVQSLITLFEALKFERDKAEQLNRAYLHEIKILGQKFEILNKPILKSEHPKPTSTAHGADQTQPKPKDNIKEEPKRKSSGTAVSITLD